MGKRIIVLSDGTGNSAAKVWRTNVWRVFQSLDLKGPDQIAIYDDGVGTSAFKPLALLGGAFGFGLKRNVLGLYKFLCRSYRSKEDYKKLDEDARKQDETATAEPIHPAFIDDEIFLFGFSRGAFTVRVLMGLVLSQGLVKYNSEKELDHKARAAFRAYRSERYKGVTLEYPFRALRNLFATHKHNAQERPVTMIQFIGVWDTVAAYGSPIDEMTRGFSRYIWPLELPDHTFKSDRIFRARQALAVDEERTTFAPVLWDEPKRGDLAADSKKLLQVWFSGVHSNVGGGYPDDSLANVSLYWMMSEAAGECKLRFKGANSKKIEESDALKLVEDAQDRDGRLYDSRAGIGGYYRYGPRRITDYYPGSKTNQDEQPIPKIHESVLARIRIGAHLYAPIGLPPKYEVVSAANRTFSGVMPENAEQRHKDQDSVWNIVWRRRAIYFLTVFTSLYIAAYPLLRQSFAYQEMATRLRIVSDTIKLFGGFLPDIARRWLDGYARDPAYLLLWVGIVSFLIAYGSALRSEINSRARRVWNEHLCHVKKPPAEAAGLVWKIVWWIFLVFLIYCTLHPLFIIPHLGKLKLTEPLDSLIRTYTEQPIRFVICVFLFVHFLPEDAIRWLRTRKLYQLGLSFIKYWLAPLVFAILILCASFAISNHLLFNVRDSFGAFCKRTAILKPSSNEYVVLNRDNTNICKIGTCSKRIEFDSSLTDPSSLCMPTGIFAVQGKRYAIDVERDPANKIWSFWNEPSFMSGQPVITLPLWKQAVMISMFPFRRTFDRPWNAFIVRYGPTGTEESFLDREPPGLHDDLVDINPYKQDAIPEHKEEVGEGWKAKRDGEIFLYLNKPVLGIWGIETWFSKNWFPSEGKAIVTIVKKAD